MSISPARAKSEEGSRDEYGTVIPAQSRLTDDDFALRASEPRTKNTPVVIILGPTGSGKTSVSVELAKALNAK